MGQVDRAGSEKRVVVLGGGFGGAYAAQRLCKVLPSGWKVTLIDRNNYILFYPLLVEAGVGTIEARHVVVPLRKFLKHGDFRMGEVLAVDTHAQQVQYQVVGSDRPQFLHYDHLVFAMGSITKMPPIPGLREHAFELKSLADSIELRDRGVRLLEIANNIKDVDRRRALLRFMVVGANYTGIELAGEYLAFMHECRRYYANVEPDDIEVMVVEYSKRILPALDEGLASYAKKNLTSRGMHVRTETSITEVGPDFAVLTTGERIATNTVVWCAGISPSPMVEKIGLPRNEKGYIECESDLRVRGFGNVWAVGDSATVFDKDGKPYAATAQNASRQGPLAADNIVRTIEGRPTKTFRFRPLGSFAAIGNHTAVANVFGVNLTGVIAYMMYRGTYLLKMPSLSRKFRLLANWTINLFARVEPVQLGLRHSDRVWERMESDERSVDRPTDRVSFR